MAKRTRAPARRKPVRVKTARRQAARAKTVRTKTVRAKTARTKPHANSRTKPLPRPHGNRLVFSPELLADGKRRYETTPESLDSIGLAFRACRSTVKNVAKQEGWVRYVPPPRDLSNAARLAAEAEKLEAALSLPPRSSLLPPPPERGRSPSEARRVGVVSAPQGTPSLTLPLSGGGDGEARMGGGEKSAAPPQDDGNSAAPGKPWSMRERIDALRNAVDEEIAAVRALRAKLKNVPHSTETAGRTSRTLADLTTTLERLHRLEIGAPQHDGPNAYDDMPADLDEFRNELARRIDAFVASRAKPGDAQGDAACPVAQGDA